LLPKIGSARAAELFFIVAVTDQVGGEAIIRRIRRRMGRSEYVKEAGLTVSSSYRLLDAIDLDPIESMDDSVEKMSGQIQDLINTELTSRRVANAD
jgi:hypothetical protein